MFSLFKKKRKSNKSNDTVTLQHLEKNFNDSVAKKILVNIKKEFGLDYQRQEYITFRKLERFALKNGLYDFHQLQTMIEASEVLKKDLINMLTVGETYFYREVNHFEILKRHMDSTRVSKILCAPSSSGEEVYSILLYLQERRRDIECEVVGIDINSEALQSAKSACYSKRSVSKLPSEVLSNYFQVTQDGYCLSEDIKKYATFHYQNVFDNSIHKLGKFDVIFCRNMLIYFDDAQKRELLERLRGLLMPNGILFLGHADINFEPKGYMKMYDKKGSYYKLMENS